MRKLSELLTMITSSESFQAVETAQKRLIDRDDFLLRYQALLDLQKRLVRAEASGQSSKAELIRSEYQKTRIDLENEPIVAIYLEGLAELDDLIHSIGEIINTGINH